jgi:hypothetical protein
MLCPALAWGLVKIAHPSFLPVRRLRRAGRSEPSFSSAEQQTGFNESETLLQRSCVSTVRLLQPVIDVPITIRRLARRGIFLPKRRSPRVDRDERD